MDSQTDTHTSTQIYSESDRHKSTQIYRHSDRQQIGNDETNQQTNLISPAYRKAERQAVGRGIGNRLSGKYFLGKTVALKSNWIAALFGTSKQPR